MIRQAIKYGFNDNVGIEPDLYIEQDEKILHFLEWYGDFCGGKNEILFVIGPSGCGKSTLIRHCSNFISRKANFEMLYKKGLTEAQEAFAQLPKSNVPWIVNQDIEDRGKLIAVIFDKIKSPGLLRMIAPYISPTFSYGPGGPEYSVKIGADILTGNYTLQDLVGFLKKKESIKYVLWFKSLPASKCEQVAELYSEIKSAGVYNFGVIISVDSAFNSGLIYPHGSSILFKPLTEEELSLLIFSVCRKNNLRYDPGISQKIISFGYNTMGSAIKLLQAVERESPNYISENIILSKMGVANK